MGIISMWWQNIKSSVSVQGLKGVLSLFGGTEKVAVTVQSTEGGIITLWGTKKGGGHFYGYVFWRGNYSSDTIMSEVQYIGALNITSGTVIGANAAATCTEHVLNY